MSDRQLIRGCLAFPTGALEGAIARIAEDTDELVVEILRGGCVGDDLLVLSEDSFFPASLWHHWTGAIAELAAAASAGLVACLYQGDGDELEIFEASGERPATRLAQRGRPDWFALEGGPRRYREAADTYTVELHPTEVAPRVHALRVDDSDQDFNELLGVTYLASDGARLYAVDAWRATQLSALDLTAPSRALHLAVDAAAVTPHLVHLPGSEGMQVWRVEGREDVDTPAGRFADCLRVGVTEHFVSTDARDYQNGRPASPPVQRTLFFADGEGLVRAVLPDRELLLTVADASETSPSETSEASAHPEPHPAFVFAILGALVLIGLLIWLL